MSKTHEDPGGREYDKGATLPGFSHEEIELRAAAHSDATMLAHVGIEGTADDAASVVEFMSADHAVSALQSEGYIVRDVDPFVSRSVWTKHTIEATQTGACVVLKTAHWCAKCEARTARGVLCWACTP